MYSSLSFNSNRDKSFVKKPDFHKDIIIPVIYSNDNYQFIKNNNYHPPPERKVLSAKLNRVQSVVQTIVSKKSIQISKKQPLYQHRLSKPQIQYKRKSLQTFTAKEPDTMFMDLDQKLHQKAMMYQQQTAYAEQKLKQARERVRQIRKDKQTKQGEEINFYLTELIPKKKSRILPPPHQIYIATSIPIDKKIRGYVQQHEERQQKRQLRNKKQVKTQSQMKVKQIKDRPKTAKEYKHKKKEQRQLGYNQYNPVHILFRCNSLMNTRLSRYQQGIDQRENIKKSLKNSAQKQKMKNLFNRIESNCLSNTLARTNIVNQMNKLAMVWKNQKQFLNSPGMGRAVMQITDDTLQLLKSRRKKEAQIAKIDQNYVQQTINDEMQLE